MKTLRRFSLLALCTLPLWLARAAVNPAIVPADARWVIYIDMNALRASAVGKEVIALAEKAQADTPAGKVGVDWQKLLTTIGSATAYGTNLSPDPKDIDGALVVQGTADLKKIAESVLIQANLANPKEVVEITDLPFPAYALKPAAGKDAAKDGEKMEVVIAFPPEPIVLVSKSRPQLLKARDLFRGQGASLAKAGDSPLKKFLRLSDGAYVFSASVVPGEKFFPEEGPQARILKMANSGALAIGERDNDTFAHAELGASSDAMADKLMKILQGMTAMISLAETNDKQLAEFLNSATVERQGTSVKLSLAYSSVRLGQMIKSLAQEQAKPKPPGERAAALLVSGRALAEWKAEPGPAPAEGSAQTLAWRTIENVALKNGALISLGRASNGGKPVRFDRIEIVAADGGAPLTFRPEFMRTAGPRGNQQQFQFPGADGNYTLKVAYVNDPDGKAAYAVSVRDPRAPQPESPEPKKQ